MLELILYSESDTLRLGEQCGSLASTFPNQQLVIGLTGKLGAGKTTFTRGVANSLGIKEPVCSPTFTMLNEYNSGSLPLYHFDLYRLSEGVGENILEDLFCEIAELLSGSGVVVVEWVDLHSQLIAEAEDLRLHFSYREDGSRQVLVSELRKNGLLQKISDSLDRGQQKDRGSL